MKFCRLGTKVLNLDAIAHADMNFPSNDAVDDWVELVIYFTGGNCSVLYGDEALTAWKALHLYSFNLTAPQQLDRAS